MLMTLQLPKEKSGCLDLLYFVYAAVMGSNLKYNHSGTHDLYIRSIDHQKPPYIYNTIIALYTDALVITYCQ